ncbi:uncharacterized protein LOC114945175 [Nylanderia fulva]|uniref:uncharacterized protein LOC114945175 n=1 Tax=Nylanderia fulva TaxID=613905 RepID=UPI0010FB6C81|nr:uncharacterized protein LOC114945175 [Nylanderia fulva]
MSLRDFILLISIVGFSTSSSIIRPQRLLIVRLSPEPMTSLADVPDRWKRVHLNFKAPQLEVHLMKSYVSPDEKWIFSHEYKYSGKDDTAAKVIPTTEEKEVPRIENNNMATREKERENNNVQDNIMMPDVIPQIGSRNIITVPTHCPKGERRDSKGRCKTVIT